MTKWKKWMPMDGIPSTMYMESLVDDREGVVLSLKDDRSDKKKLTVNFEGGVLSYKNTDEGSLLGMLHYLDQHYGADFYSNWTLFEVENSEYIDWFLRESSGIYSKEKIKHYVFLTSDDVIEILSTYPPKVTLQDI